LEYRLIETLREQWARVQSLDNEIAPIEGRLKRALAETPTCQMISDIPSVGLMTATAAVATMGDTASFKTWREFAAWLGVVPRQPEFDSLVG
jgi:transposase